MCSIGKRVTFANAVGLQGLEREQICQEQAWGLSAQNTASPMTQTLLEHVHIKPSIFSVSQKAPWATACIISQFTMVLHFPACTVLHVKEDSLNSDGNYGGVCWTKYVCRYDSKYIHVRKIDLSVYSTVHFILYRGDLWVLHWQIT